MLNSFRKLYWELYWRQTQRYCMSRSYSVFSSSALHQRLHCEQSKVWYPGSQGAGGLCEGSRLKTESRKSLCNCNWKIREAFLLNPEILWYNLKRGEIKLHIAFCSLVSTLLAILFINTPLLSSCWPLNQPGRPATGSWPTPPHQERQDGLLQCPAYQPEPLDGWKYHKCIFIISPLIKCKGSLCDLFNYIQFFPKHFIFCANSWTDRPRQPLHLNLTKSMWGEAIGPSELETSHVWVEVLSPSLISCMIWGNLLKLSKLVFSLVK